MWFSAETRARYEPWVLAALVLMGALTARHFQADAAKYTSEDLEHFGHVSGISVEGWPEHPFLINWVGGDGQVFAAFAAEPIHGGHRVKDSAHRFTRAGYSWIAAAVSLGQDRWVPYGLIAVNSAAVFYVAYIAWRHRRDYGVRIWWLLANPALYIGFLGDTAETLGIALLSAALVSGSSVAAAILATVRPSFLVGVARNARQLLIGGAVAVVMRLIAGWLFDSSPANGVYNLTWPFAGYLEVPSVVGWVVALGALVTVVLGVLQRRIGWVLSGLLVLMFGGSIHVSGQVNIVRAAGILPVMWALDPSPAANEEGLASGEPFFS